MAKIKIKPTISAWLFKNPTEAKKPWEKALVEFRKEYPKLEVRNFKVYHKEYNEGKLAKPAPKKPLLKSTLKTSLKILHASKKGLNKKDVQIEFYRTGVVKLPEGIFVPYKMNRPVDRLFSDEGGIMKGTISIIDGGPSIGKTTVVYSWASALKLANPDLKICCINSEMKSIELEYEQKKKAWMAGIDFIVLNDIRKKFLKKLEAEKKSDDEIDALLSLHYIAVLKKIFDTGFDVIIIDSYHDIVSKMKDFCDMTEPQAERELLRLIDKAVDGENETGAYSAVVSIQQVGKSGIHKGSQQLKHAVQCWAHFRFDDKGLRYIEFIKNRRNGADCYKRLYYWQDANGEIQYDEKAFEQLEHIRKNLNIEKGLLDNNFLDLFKKQDIDVVGSTLNTSSPAVAVTTIAATNLRMNTNELNDDEFDDDIDED